VGGIVDAMRVSPDVTIAWKPRTPLPGLYEAASSAGNATATSQLDTGRRRRMAGSIAAGGALTVVSDDLSLYGEDDWALLESIRTSPDAPLELPDPFSAHSAS